MLFQESFHCESRVHCKVCRTDAAWRAVYQAPDVCPFGITTDALPPPPIQPVGGAPSGPPLTHRPFFPPVTQSPPAAVSIDAKLDAVLRALFDDGPPCDFPGFEEMQTRYKADLAEAGGAACPSCRLGAVKNKYVHMIRDQLKSQS